MTAPSYGAADVDMTVPCSVPGPRVTVFRSGPFGFSWAGEHERAQCQKPAGHVDRLPHPVMFAECGRCGWRVEPDVLRTSRCGGCGWEPEPADCSSIPLHTAEFDGATITWLDERNTRDHYHVVAGALMRVVKPSAPA